MSKEQTASARWSVCSLLNVTVAGFKGTEGCTYLALQPAALARQELRGCSETHKSKVKWVVRSLKGTLNTSWLRILVLFPG